MSFALEYRKKMQAEAKRARARQDEAESPEDGFILAPPGRSAETRANRRRVLAALVLAGLVLGVFNSGALVHYAGGLGYNEFTMRAITLAERWDRLMRENRLTLVTSQLRDMAAQARRSRWRDLAFGLPASLAQPDSEGRETARSGSGKGEQPQSEPAGDVGETLAPAPAPVLRAAVERQ